MHTKKNIIVWVLSCWIVPFAMGQQDEILDLSLEELMGMEVTSVSKKAQRLQDVPSSIQVITTEDIVHSGATNLVELLREMVPGYWAATIDFYKYEAFLRNSYYASFLVLLDGTPMNDMITSSMIWENFELPLTAIDRIEVVRGSGGVIYGANSASGVISIFTKAAEDQPLFSVTTDIAYPLHSGTNLAFNKKLNEKISLGLYGRYRYFSGYEQMPSIENETALVPASSYEGDTLITNRFTGDDKTVHMYAAGLNFRWEISDKLRVSSNMHFNGSNQRIYTQNYPPEQSRLYLTETGGIAVEGTDIIQLVDHNKQRITGNVRADYEISADHQLFLRVSTNAENYHQILFGGVNYNNSIYDFEIQDNLTLGFNNLSFGANYRLLNYDIPEIAFEGSLNYIDRQNTETLTGFFVQDNIELLDDKLNFYLGAKAENFSLINDQYYFSPMAKITAALGEKLTLWGGYTKSYTTPGYQQTNIAVNFLRVPSPEGFAEIIPAIATQTVIDQAGIPESDIPAFLATQAAQDAIAATIPGLTTIIGITWPDYFNTGITNGDDTEPTSFANFEVGLRWQVTDAVYVESNFYHTIVTDDITNSPIVLDTIQSPTNPRERMETAYYGNYIDGTNTGMETIIKYQVTDGLFLELSHALFTSEREYKANDDFDVTLDTIQNSPLTNEQYPRVPQNIFRGRLKYAAPAGIHVSISALYATAFYNKFGTVDPIYQYEHQRWWPLFGDTGRAFQVGRNDDRTILNFKVAKTFSDNLSVYAFGNDVLSKAFVESTSVLSLVYPRQTGRMIGMGITFQL